MPPWLLGAALAVLGVLLAIRRSRRAQLHETRPHGFAAIRVLLPHELVPYFGVYAPARADLVGYAFMAAWYWGLVTFASVLAFMYPAWAVVLVSLVTAGLASAAVYAESRSKRVIGPSVIAYVSVLPTLSWSVPLLEVTQCEVVPGSPNPRLRICTRQRSRLLPLTANLYKVLSAGYA